MLGNLKKVQDQLYSNESIEIFLKTHPLFDVVAFLNKANKGQTKVRVRRFFYKLSESDHYETYLLAALTSNKNHQKQFAKYISSDNSEEYFELLQKKQKEVLKIMESDPTTVPLIFSLVYHGGGIKMIKFFSNLFTTFHEVDLLYSPQVKQELERGIAAEDSVVQMRFVEILANIATKGGKNYNFVSDLLEKSLQIYTTEDILLKLNIVQVVGSLGGAPETAQLLKEHKIWSYVEKDALNPHQQFYVRKNLLTLLVEMYNNGFYEFSPKFSKNTIEFLQECLSNKGEYLEGGLDLICSLFKSNEGTKIVAQNNQLFSLFLAISLSPQDQIRNQYLVALTSLADKTNKAKSIVINVFSSIGNPNLSGQFSHNIGSNHYTMAGIEPFCDWLSQFFVLPFEELEMNVMEFLIGLMGYPEICQVLFEEQKLTKFLLKPLTSTNKKLRSLKNKLVGMIIEKGENEWKGTKLEPYSQMIEKELKKEKMELEYDMMADG